MGKTTEKVFVCIASIPVRKHSLVDTIKSLLPQVDKIYLYLNNYDNQTATQIKRICPDKIEYIIGDNSFGDAGKFYWANKLKGYIITADDDLVFPRNYVSRIIDGIERYERKAIVCFHGRTLKLPLTSYYRDYKGYFGFNNELKNDTYVHIAGTGCMGWHSQTIKISMKDDFLSPNMGDIYLSILAQKSKVPIIVLAHSSNWIEGTYYPPNNSISGTAIKSDKEQTEIVNKIDWRIYKLMWVNESNRNDIYPSVAYVINLSHRADRYRYAFNECMKNGIVPIRIDAIDGKKRFLNITPSPLMQAHYGCSASHIEALKVAIQSEQKYSFIIEDDCVIAEDFKRKIANYSSQLPKDWDLFYLGGSLINKSTYSGGSKINDGAVSKISENLYKAKNVLTTHAYIIKNSSIQKLLNVIESRKDRIDTLFCEFQKKNNCFIVYPELAWQRAGYSDIVERETNNIHLKYSD